MIVVKLMGGLGNQMFQYAAGRALALKHNTELFLDLSWLSKDPEGAYTQRAYELGPFKIEAQIAGQDILDQFKTTSRITNKLKSYLPATFGSQVFNESRSTFHSRFFSLPSTCYLNGYWQNEKYFREIRERLREEFDLKTKSVAYTALSKHVATLNSVSIHVRHGDYVSVNATNKFHGVLPVTYYQNAVEYLKQQHKDLSFIIFSDDQEWCMKHLSFIKDADFIEGRSLSLTIQDELLFMGHCRHNIIANSSFSWWAAWLNQYKDKTVIAPKQWFNTGQAQPPELIPNGWIRL